MKVVEIVELTERYVDCPYCCFLISDAINIDENEMSSDNVIECPSCKKKFKLK